MAKVGRTLQNLAAEIERRAEVKRDLIAPVSKLSAEVVNGEPVLAVHNGSIETFPLNTVANGQLAEYVEIPRQYFNRMATEAPELLASNVNRWFRDKKDERRMVRLLDNRNRAFLSDKFRTLENEDLAEAVLPILLDMNLLFLSCEITDRRLYIKCVDQSILKDVPTGRMIGDGSHVFFDTVSPAITISNSEVGAGRLMIETGVYTKVCTNLAMIGHGFKKHHVGSRADVSDEVYALLSDDTRKVTDAAVWRQVRDVVKGAFEAARFQNVVDKLTEASGAKIEPTIVTEVIERVGKRFSLNEGERKGVLGRLIEGGDLTLYGLHSAITRHSADVEEYDRATELERIGGELIELPIPQARQLIAA